jgi:hypothetical protein
MTSADENKKKYLTAEPLYTRNNENISFIQNRCVSGLLSNVRNYNY